MSLYSDFQDKPLNSGALIVEDKFSQKEFSAHNFSLKF